MTVTRIFARCLVAALIFSSLGVREATADMPYIGVYCGPLLGLTPALNPGERLRVDVLSELHTSGELPFPAATVLYARGLHIVLSASRMECLDRGCDGVAVVVVGGKTITSDDFRVGAETPLEVSRGARDNDDCEPGSVLHDSWDNFTVITPAGRVEGFLGVGVQCDDIIANKHPGRTLAVGGWKTEMVATRPETHCPDLAARLGAPATQIPPEELRRRILREEAGQR